jgi:GNAT superfamily N-acetyltransferase
MGLSKMRVKIALADDYDLASWKGLAEEVTPLFGPMIGFEAILERKVGQKQAFSARVISDPSIFVGGILLGGPTDCYWIRWLAITSEYRRAGIGKMVLETALESLTNKSAIYVDTFVNGMPGAEAAGLFYENNGFKPFGINMVDGVKRQRYKRQPIELNQK